MQPEKNAVKWEYKAQRSGWGRPQFHPAEQRRLIMGKKLYKSNKNKILDGVCGGIAEYFNIDPTLVRLGWVVFCALGGSGVLAYIVAALIIPRDPEC